jgi:hypothetical protein
MKENSGIRPAFYYYNARSIMICVASILPRAIYVPSIILDDERSKFKTIWGSRSLQTSSDRAERLKNRLFCGLLHMSQRIRRSDYYLRWSLKLRQDSAVVLCSFALQFRQSMSINRPADPEIRAEPLSRRPGPREPRPPFRLRTSH